MSAKVVRGNVVFFDQEKGFGFIESDQGRVFLHRYNLRESGQASTITAGTLLEFIVVSGKHKQTGVDQLVAKNVIVVENNLPIALEGSTKIASLGFVVADSDQPLRKHGLGLARELIRQNGEVFNKKLVKALAYGLGEINSEEQYTRAKQLVCGNQKANDLHWKRLNAVLFDQANNAYKLRLWLDEFVTDCDFLLIENAYLKGDSAQRLAISNRCTADQQVALAELVPVVQERDSVSHTGISVHFTGIKDTILAELSRAKRRIRVAVAWFTSHYLFDALCQRVREGLQVELIILNDPINNWTGGLNFQEFIDLGKAGGNSRLYFSNVEDRLLHHKFCVIDEDVLLNGSYNWTYYAEGRNTENCMIFKEHPALIEQFGKEFTRLTEVLQRVEAVVPFDEAFAPALDMHRVGVYRSNDVLTRAKETRRTNANLATKLIRQALELNPENEEAKRMLPKPPVRQNEQSIREAGIQASLDEIEATRKQLQRQNAAAEELARKRTQEAAARLEAQQREQQAQARERELEQQRKADEESRLLAEKAALEARAKLEEQEQKRLRDIAAQQRELQQQQERIVQAKRENEERATREREAQEKAAREAQQRAQAAAEARAKQERELAEKAAALEATKGVVMQGGRGELRINLAWQSLDDLDLHVYDPAGNQICYSSREATCQGSLGKLDVDANAGGAKTRTPQENVFWSNNPPEGRYRVEVNNYSVNELSDCPFVVTVNPEVGQPKVLAGKTIGAKKRVKVIEFDYSRTKGMSIVQAI